MDHLVFAVSHTTRKMRHSEVEGRDYYFVTEDEFKQMIKNQVFAEWANVHGHYYGTSRKEIEKKDADKGIILDIDIQGAKQIKDAYKEALFIFIFPPAFHELKKRLLDRGDETPESIGRRLEVAKKEIQSYPEFDYIIINDRLDEAVKELTAVVLSTGCRAERRRKEIEPILLSFFQEEM